MTIVIAVTVPDGIVLAADSRTTAEIGGVPRAVSDSTDKVFEVHSRAIATFGWAFLEGSNIAAHIAQYRISTAKTGLTVKEFAEDLVAYFEPKVQAEQAARTPLSPG